jgi:hypothetical protein
LDADFTRVEAPPETRLLRCGGLARRVVARFFEAEGGVTEVALLRRSFLDFIGNRLISGFRDSLFLPCMKTIVKT